MLASPRATVPSFSDSSMVPRSSSCAARMLAASSTLVGVSFSSCRTMNWIAVVAGASPTIARRMNGATKRATRSAAAMAKVFGSTAEKITIRTVTMPVA